MQNSTQKTAQQHAAITLATLVAFILAFALTCLAFPAPERALAANKASHFVTTKIVKKNYHPSKQKMAITMAGGDVTQIGLNAAGSKVTWAVSKKQVVRITPIGKRKAKITALNPGTTIITAKSGGSTLACKVTVTGALNKTSVNITPLTSHKLSLKGATAKKWKSSDFSIATVDKNGKITPKKTGSATITCTDRKGYQYTCAVVVSCPNIRCEMNEVANSRLLKHFKLTNKSGKKLILHDARIHYFPDESSKTPFVLYGLTDALNKKSFSDIPVTVTNRQSHLFWGYDNDPSSRTEAGIFGMFFKIKNVQYYARFRTSGEMVACGRA